MLSTEIYFAVVGAQLDYGRAAALGLLLLWSLAPLIWQLYSSLVTPEALVNPGSVAAGSFWTLENYRQLLQADPPFWRYLVNSTLVGAATTALTLGTSGGGAAGQTGSLTFVGFTSGAVTIQPGAGVAGECAAQVAVI